MKHVFHRFFSTYFLIHFVPPIGFWLVVTNNLMFKSNVCVSYAFVKMWVILWLPAYYYCIYITWNQPWKLNFREQFRDCAAQNTVYPVWCPLQVETEGLRRSIQNLGVLITTAAVAHTSVATGEGLRHAATGQHHTITVTTKDKVLSLNDLVSLPFAACAE